MKAFFLKLVRCHLIVPVIIGTIAFAWIAGGGILFPDKVDWLMEGDSGNSFLGWHFYRNAPLFQSPFGSNPDYGGDISNSILFSDSLPLFAFLFKPFNSMLPPACQYFGVWIWLCFSLQAVFAWQLLGRLGCSRWITVMGTLFFVLSPPMLWRLYGHYSLCAHWVILAAYLLYLSPRYDMLKWVILNAVTSLIHGYLLGMVLIFWGVDLIKRLMLREWSVFVALRNIGVGVVSLTLVMWQAGYFMPGGGASSDGFGYYRMNLLSPIDSDGKWSRLLMDLPGGKGDYEGFNYLGLGMIVLCGLAFVVALRSRLKIRWIQFLPLLIISIVLSVFAFSHHIALGSHELVTYWPPASIKRLANIFRSSGRFFWPVYYLAYLGVFFVISTRLSRRAAAWLLFFALSLQIFDMYPAIGEFRHKFRNPKPWTSPLRSAFWKDAEKKYKKIVYVLPYDYPKDHVAHLALGYYASSSKMTINMAFLNRVDKRKLSEARDRTAEMVRAGKYDQDTLYLFEEEDLWEIALGSVKQTDKVEIIDGFKVLAPGMALEHNSIAHSPKDGPPTKTR